MRCLYVAGSISKYPFTGVHLQKVSISRGLTVHKSLGNMWELLSELNRRCSGLLVIVLDASSSGLNSSPG